MKIETRAVSMTTTNKPLILEGYAVVFNTPAQVGNFEEIILREALSETDLSDVALFYNHDTNRIPLARTPKTLQLKTDARGLKFTAELPDSEEGRAIYESVKRGDLRGCSFAFTVEKDIWVKGKRIIRQISKIYECSIVPYPAYSDTTVEARNRKGVLKMKFENVAQAFNFYNQKTIAQIEKRAAEIETELSEEGADVKSLNIELEGMKAAKENIEESIGLLNNAKTTLLNLIETSDTESVDGNTAPPDEEKVLSSDEYRTAFYKTLQGKKLNSAEVRAMKFARAKFERRAAGFNTSTDNAAIIPTETLNEIISKARTQGGLLAECRAFSIPSNVAIPVATPSDRAAWHVEGAAVDSEKITPITITFSGNEIIKVFSLSLKAQAMTISAFESYLTQELTDSVMETIEYALINGTGNGQGTGLMSIFDSDNTVAYTDSAVVDGTPNTPAARSIGYSMIIEAISKLKRGYANGAKFAMNNHTLWTVFYHLQDGNQRPLFIQNLQDEGIGKILGFPVIIDDNIADGDVIFGNFNFMAYNLPQGIMIETSRESSFKSGLIDYRAIAIADTKPLMKEAFVLLSQNLQS